MDRKGAPTGGSRGAARGTAGLVDASRITPAGTEIELPNGLRLTPGYGSGYRPREPQTDREGAANGRRGKGPAPHDEPDEPDEDTDGEYVPDDAKRRLAGDARARTARPPPAALPPEMAEPLERTFSFLLPAFEAADRAVVHHRTMQIYLKRRAGEHVSCSGRRSPRAPSPTSPAGSLASSGAGLESEITKCHRLIRRPNLANVCPC
ncbi:hypothetical protein DFJ74DRAFT_344918 [Hyaloraphidium curvatum]|nr:hypothetical protein DFJ74DRAFT_344918 [Hyaloraphidium curvatum]